MDALGSSQEGAEFHNEVAELVQVSFEEELPAQKPMQCFDQVFSLRD